MQTATLEYARVHFDSLVKETAGGNVRIVLNPDEYFEWLNASGGAR
jgi:hypothetical protein